MKTHIIPDSAIHDDWYCDGCEDKKQLWRMDFRVGDNGFQAQLFAEVDRKQLGKHGHLPARVPREAERYTSFRLFLERDNRGTVGADDCARIDYAFAAWRVPYERAVKLLGLSEKEFPGAIEDEVKHVATLPCVWEYCAIGADGQINDDY